MQYTYLEHTKVEITPSRSADARCRIRLDGGHSSERLAVGRVEHRERALFPVDLDCKVVPVRWGEGGLEEDVERVIEDFERACVWCWEGTRWIGERRTWTLSIYRWVQGRRGNHQAGHQRHASHH